MNENDKCPICGGELDVEGEQLKFFPPGTVVEVLVCADNPSHRFETDGEEMEVILD